MATGKPARSGNESTRLRVLNALRHRGDRQKKPAAVQIHRPRCSTPYGIVATGNYRASVTAVAWTASAQRLTASWRQANRSIDQSIDQSIGAQRLTASWRQANRAGVDGRGAGAVLNALRHRGDRQTAASTAPTRRRRRGAQRLTASWRQARRRVGAPIADTAVLNALRHRGDRQSTSPSPARPVAASCSTPYGIVATGKQERLAVPNHPPPVLNALRHRGDRQAGPAAARGGGDRVLNALRHRGDRQASPVEPMSALPAGAQRLTASWRQAILRLTLVKLSVKRAQRLTASWRQAIGWALKWDSDTTCSTPYGIVATGKRRRRDWCQGRELVLNALRHRGDRQASQHLQAVCRQCVLNALRHRGDRQRPRGKAARRARRVLNALRHRGDRQGNHG